MLAFGLNRKPLRTCKKTLLNELLIQLIDPYLTANRTDMGILRIHPRPS
jgi:hypothetical protein